MKKFLAAVAMLAVAGSAAFFLKDYIDSENPEFAVAQIEVTVDGQVAPHVMAGYHWRFYNGRSAERAEQQWYDVDMQAAEARGGEALSIRFTQTPEAVEVSRIDWDSYEFTGDTAETTVPFNKGVYVYSVRADFGRGWARYYFKLAVT